MQQRNDLSCTCIGNTFNPQDKWFLTKKKDVDQVESPPHQRRINKSSDVKHQSEDKIQKKSLKKRAGSIVGSDQHLPSAIIIDNYKNQSQIKINFASDDSKNNHNFSFSRGGDSPMNSLRQINSPQSINYSEHLMKQKLGHQMWDQKNFSNFIVPMNHQIQQSHSHLNHQRHRHHVRNIEHNIQNHYQQSPIQTFAHTNIPVMHQAKRSLQTENVFSSPIPNPNPKQENSIQKIHYPMKNEKETQSWIPLREDALIIEGFDRLFKNREEHQSHAQLNQDKHMKSKESKKSKRLLKQPLLGRFAQSDNEDVCSDSASEVIGKGFDNNFQSFWELDEANRVEETLATRSTNTKFSELKQGQLCEGTAKPKFGATPHFKSYKYL